MLSSSLAEEINVAQKLAAEVATLVDLGKHELARLRSNDLHDRTLTIIVRWDKTLPALSKENFEKAKFQVETLRDVVSRLGANTAAPTQRQFSHMRGRCEKIKDIFIAEHASALRRKDEADNG